MSEDKAVIMNMRIDGEAYATYIQKMLNQVRDARYTEFFDTGKFEEPAIRIDVRKRQILSDRPIYEGARLVPGETIYWSRSPVNEKSIIPALEIPAAPVEPEPVVEPESASVQMLRELLDDRRAEKVKVEGSLKSRQHQIDNLQKRIDELNVRQEDDERHIAAAQVSIESTLADIKKLGGRPEPKT